MSYRSQIVIAIKPEVFEDASPKVKDAFFNIWDEPDCEEENRIVFFYDCIQWLDGVDNNGDSISIIEEWLKSLYKEEYGLVELGEDDGDVRYEGNPSAFDIGYVRKVTF